MVKWAGSEFSEKLVAYLDSCKINCTRRQLFLRLTVHVCCVLLRIKPLYPSFIDGTGTVQYHIRFFHVCQKFRKLNSTL